MPEICSYVVSESSIQERQLFIFSGETGNTKQQVLPNPSTSLRAGGQLWRCHYQQSRWRQFNPPPSICARTDRTVRRTILPASKNTTAFVSVRARRNSTTTDHWDIQSRSSGSSGSNCSQAYFGFSDRTRTICWIIYLLSWSCKMSRPDRKEYGQVDEPKSPNIGKQNCLQPITAYRWVCRLPEFCIRISEYHSSIFIFWNLSVLFIFVTIIL